MFARLLLHDLRILIRDGSLLVAAAVLAIALGYALWNGMAWKEARLAAAGEAARVAAQEQHNVRADIVSIAEDAGNAQKLPRAGLPTAVAVPAIKAPGVLAELGVGQEDLLPYRASVSAWGRVDSLFRRYQVDNPQQLAAGRFDVAFVIVYVLPLLLMLLAHHALAAERDSGTQPLLYSHAVTPARVLWTRVALRASLLLAVVAIVVGGGLFAFGASVASPGRGAAFALWVILVLLYVAVWTAIAGAVAARNRSAGNAALASLGAWLVFVVLVPGAINLLVQTAYPLPSRAEYIATLRAAEIRASKVATERLATYMHDHPELIAAQDGAVADWMKSHFLTERTLEAETAPVVRRFESTLDSQRRLLAWLRVSTPTLIMQELLGRATGTSLERHERFVREVRAFKTRWNGLMEPFLMRGSRLDLATFDALPRFRFAEAHAGQVARGTLAGSAILVGYLGLGVLLARYRLRAFRPGRGEE